MYTLAGGHNFALVDITLPWHGNNKVHVARPLLRQVDKKRVNSPQPNTKLAEGGAPTLLCR